ncbi:MAG TPA: agmatine deiminase family protein [Gemmataceae bacterium]|nr:agmatine deiminase family protein [Gemmataceae bacterium]
MHDPSPQGCRLPAEWEPHEATWIAWPHNKDDWPGKFAPIPWVYAEIVRHLHQSETVRVLVNDAAGEKRARRVLTRAGVDLRRVEFFRVRTDRVWTRDYGPMFVQSPEGLGIMGWSFNAWAKYPDWRRDERVKRTLAGRLSRQEVSFYRAPTQGLPRATSGVVLEGGSIDVNGRGCLLTTEECLLSPVQERNPGFTPLDYERVFAEHLGIRKTLWLGKGIAGDDTHGHVDDLARFVGPRTVVAAVEDDPADENYRPLQENLERLRGMTDQDGRPLEVVPLPMPRPLFFDGRRLPASYANFYIANDRVLVPTFNDPNDRKALGLLADLFPGRTVVGIHAVDLVWGLGTLHCLTQQQPKAAPAG